MENRVFNEFYNKYINYNSDYGGKFSNHMPMVAYSLFEMGEPLDKIEEYLDLFVKKNQCIEEDLSVKYNITDDNFREYLGASDSLGSYYKYFKDKSNNSSVENLIKEYVEVLLEGSAARAFHPLIRLAYGVKSKNDEEIIRSLSYFASTFLTHEIKGELKISKNIINDINTLSELLGNEKFEGSLIADKIERAYGMDEFRENIFSLGHNENDIIDMLDKIINKLYVETRGFTILHAVTSKEAIKTLLPYINNKKRALDNYWIAIAGAYVTVGAPKVSSLEVSSPSNLPDFGEIIAKSISTKNDHNIKLTYSCNIEFKNSGNNIYKYMAFLENEKF
ncbi:MAG: questin oxidase family protein [Clostridium sp.]